MASFNKASSSVGFLGVKGLPHKKKNLGSLNTIYELELRKKAIITSKH
jgi:hypothetical protein